MPSGKEISEFSQPRALTLEEIPKVIDDFRRAARNAIRAGKQASIQRCVDY